MGPQQTIAHYRITAKLGEGGMGEVWRATDTKLGREVAIKVLPEAFANDSDRMARFEREAKVLASLNHPNIAAIHGVEERALVMELVEGPTLAERIAQGAIPWEEGLPVAKQVAEALEYAHDRGIVHRDLKPANIKVTPEGRVKVLDFGLAAIAQATAADSANPMSSPTLTMRATQMGVIMGTAAYMSPEQARGKPADKRADIWAFGVVLYEMLTGRQLFGGETISDTLAAVMRDTPDLSKLPPDTPPRIRRLLARCLPKDVKIRMRDIGEARILIDEPEEAAAPAIIPGPVRRAWLSWAVAVLATALVVAAGIAWKATRPRPLLPLIRLTSELGSALTTTLPAGRPLNISPDGTRLALVVRTASGKQQLGTRLLQQSQVNLLSGTENASGPFFSPDGEWIGFSADGKLKKISVAGGAPITLCEAPNLRGASWGDDGNIIAALGVAEPLSLVPSSGGRPVPLTKLSPGERTHRYPQVLPGGQTVLFVAATGVGIYDDATIDVVSRSGVRKTVYRGGHSPHYLPSGHLIYQHANTLFAVRFDAGRLEIQGTPVPVLEDVSSGGGSFFNCGSTGTCVYLTGGTRPVGWSIFRMDRASKLQPLQAAPSNYFTPRLSPDGKRLAFAKGNSQGTDIWVKDLQRDTATQLSFLTGENRNPVWTPDGKEIVFRSQNPQNPGLYCIRSDGSGEAERLTNGSDLSIPSCFSPDGRRLAFETIVAEGNARILTVSVERDSNHLRLGKPEPFLGSKNIQTAPAFSPDGRWLAYMSNESGTFEVYVRPFPGPGGRWQISASGGVYPRWSQGERELFFVAADQRLMVATYSAAGDTFVPGKPQVWSEGRIMNLTMSVAYDIEPDGKQAVVFSEPDQPSADQKPVTQATFLLNFLDELRRRVP
jgi:serine/threonine-protein kinase